MSDSMHVSGAVADQPSEIFTSPKAGRLTKEQGIKLLTRLVSDEAFRQRFESAPANALLEIGVTQETIETLASRCFLPRQLASNEVLQETLNELRNGETSASLSMVVPHVRLQFEKA